MKRRSGSPLVRWAWRLLKLALAVPLLVLGGLFAWAWQERSMRALEPWHEHAPAGEYTREFAEVGFGFDDYLALEERLFAAAVREYRARPGETSPYSRYARGGPDDPESRSTDWNRSFELVPDEPRGGALLLHGLTDSPYSVRSLAELLVAEGYHVLALRLPGHGLAPAGLLEVEWEDWTAAVRMAARHLADEVAGAPLVLCGYSMGGALAVGYAAEALRDPELPRPERLVLLSPAIGVSALGRVSNWHEVFSWIPGLHKSRWLSIDAELDPWKFSSFPKNAGRQMWALARRVQGELTALQREGLAGELPPMLAFQSIVDATILAHDLLSGLFERLPANGSELVVFDLNRSVNLEGLLVRDYRGIVPLLEEGPARGFRLTLVTNREPDVRAVVERSRAPGQDVVVTAPLGLEWPPEIYSLSHVAVPFPPDDPTYGLEPVGESGRPPLLGSLLLRGETGVLAIPADQRLRLRCNPFHAYLRRVVADTLAGRR
jgi:alpha-beta hydrolase superfamily lysophospholipase